MYKKYLCLVFLSLFYPQKGEDKERRSTTAYFILTKNRNPLQYWPYAYMIVIPPLYDSRTGSVLVLHCAQPISVSCISVPTFMHSKNVIKKRTYNSLIPHFISTGSNSDHLCLLTHLAAKLIWVEHALCLPNICVFRFCPTFYATKNIWKRRRSMTLPLTSPTN